MYFIKICLGSIITMCLTFYYRSSCAFTDTLIRKKMRTWHKNRYYSVPLIKNVSKFIQFYLAIAKNLHMNFDSIVMNNFIHSSMIMI